MPVETGGGGECEPPRCRGRRAWGGQGMAPWGHKDSEGLVASWMQRPHVPPNGAGHASCLLAVPGCRAVHKVQLFILLLPRRRETQQGLRESRQ